jgi:hypothetical protein
VLHITQLLRRESGLLEFMTQWSASVFVKVT